MRYYLLFCLLSGLPLTAQNPTPPQNYAVEELKVNGLRYTTAEIVISASQLKPNKTYNENQLQKAMNRIKQLAFVRDAEFSLARGSARGKYDLVITITEFAPVFYDIQTNYNKFMGNDISSFDGFNLTGRWFFGRGNMVYATLIPDWTWSTGNPGPDFHRYRLGYTHYNLFNRGIFLNAFADVQTGVTFETSFGFTIESEDELEPGLELSIPLKPGHWLRLLAVQTEDESKSTGDNGFISSSAGENRSYSATWEYNTTDDPWQPMRGMRLEGTTSFGDDKDISESFQALPDSEPRENTTVSKIDTLRFFTSAEVYFPVDARQSLSLSGYLNYRDSDVNLTSLGTNVPVNNPVTGSLENSSLEITPGYRFSPWRQRPQQKFGEFFLDVLTTYEYRESETRSEGMTMSDSDTQIAFSRVNMTWRNAWGVARLGFYYTWHYEHSRSPGGE
ncbi:MAG: hypothetical protein QNK37_22255 [Acidobacteriota bacterium]|nr:hypothetical protein [Acidobacteriota bacterium]